MSLQPMPAVHTLVPSGPSFTRSGFTIAELIVALVLLTVGLLALASTSAFLTYAHAASGRAEQAAVAAGSRLEMLRAGPCAAAQGTQTLDGLTMTWAVTPSEAHSATATVQVSWKERGAPSVQRYATAFAC